ncbi:hypothetical protein BDV98DRAFT_565457 [Pterulicium gracile]|uniref:Uncharacterized protein n=1 Tax=Pterulicium gracile TaxID=1884261 RepID=A0A5C3QQQ1_9AGAR|nr:hypothetical protein BDV98DRAFT_565457 [Pterula gracilis]
MSTPRLPTLTKREEVALSAILTPSNHTVRQLTDRLIGHLLDTSHAAVVLQADPERSRALHQALETSPDREYIGIITGKPGESTMPPKGSPTNQEERWAILKAYRGYLEKPSLSYEDYFFRSMYAMSAALMMQEFISKGVAGVRSGPQAASKYYGRTWQETLQRENPEAYAKAHASMLPPPPHESRTPVVLDAQKSTYELMDAILCTDKPPSLTDITAEAAEGIKQSDAAHLHLMEFIVQVDKATFLWKVKSVELSRLQVRFFWVQFAVLPDGEDSLTEEESSMLLEEDNVGSQIRVSEGDLVQLLRRSIMH